MSTHQTTVPAAEGKANAGTVQTGAGATPWTPNREAGERPSALGNDDGEILGGTPRYPSSSPLGSASTPRWSAVDDDTADLLTLVANQQSALPEPERQWQHFLSVMRQVARRDMFGLFIDQNDARKLLRGEVSPSRVGAFYHRAARMGLIRRAGWNESDDRASRNRGKPQNTWEWLGT